MPETHLKFHSSNGKRRILVIEDELINREILGFMLQDAYELLFAETGRQAMELLETDCRTLSLVLLDLNLPDMKGIDILHVIKGNARTALLPVIVMTADQNAEVECLSLGATDFISKPYPKQEIVLARIRRTIELFEDRDSIEDYWNHSPVLQEIRSAQKKPEEPCASCRFENACRHCMAVNLKLHGRLSRGDATCPLAEKREGGHV